jgi:polysaccharide export outer membrane protein
MQRQRASIAALFIACAFALGACTTNTTTSDTGITLKTSGISPSTTFTSALEQDTTIISVGDSISFSVWGYPEFNTRAIVKLNGTITVPLIGEQLAAGLKVDELGQNLKMRLAEYVKGEVKVSLEIERPSPRITVLGMVARPGSFSAKADIPLLEVLADMGGWTELADLRYIRINRQALSMGQGGSLEINLQLLLDRGNTRAIPMIRPGDVIIVPRQENIVRELSEFLRDGLLLLGVFQLTK